MSQTTSVPSISAGQLKDSARGALIGAFFGSVWIYWAVAFSGNPKLLWFLIVTVPAVALVAWTIFSIRAVRHFHFSAADLEHSKTFRKFFWVDVGIECGLSGAAVFTLVRFGRFDLMPQAVAVIVGLHFLPLVKIFRTHLYYWTSILMVIAALGSLLIHRGYIRNIFVCGVVGLILWATSVVRLYRISSGVGEQIRSIAAVKKSA
jgi:hypothetical protein